jgi:zinc transporter ZupT
MFGSCSTHVGRWCGPLLFGVFAPSSEIELNLPLIAGSMAVIAVALALPMTVNFRSKAVDSHHTGSRWR